MVETRFTQTPVILNHLMMLPIEKALGKVSVVGAVVYCLELLLGPRHSFTYFHSCWECWLLLPWESLAFDSSLLKGAA